MKADLHMHSTHSDGLLPTEELFKRAQRNKVDMIAITDHDVVRGADENFTFSKKYGVKYIVGIELSTVEQGKSVHLLGYFTDESYKSTELLNYYIEIKSGREERAKKFISNLEKMFDIHIEYDNVFKFTRGVVARPHIAMAIMNKYPQYDMRYIFDHFIGDDSPAYVPTCELTVKEGINLLRRNNCVVVLAHPTLLKKQIKEDVLQNDFDGLEAVYLRNQEKDEQEYRELANKRGMIVTGGGDFHGIENDPLHGDIGDVYIDGQDLDSFITKLKEKNKT